VTIIATTENSDSMLKVSAAAVRVSAAIYDLAEASAEAGWGRKQWDEMDAVLRYVVREMIETDREEQNAPKS